MVIEHNSRARTRHGNYPPTGVLGRYGYGWVAVALVLVAAGITLTIVAAALVAFGIIRAGRTGR